MIMRRKLNLKFDGVKIPSTIGAVYFSVMPQSSDTVGQECLGLAYSGRW